MIAYILCNLCFMFRNVCNKEFTNRFSGKQNNMFFNAICRNERCPFFFTEYVRAVGR